MRFAHLLSNTVILFILSIFFAFFYTSPVFAQPANCVIGPKIAGNISVENYSTIMQQYSHCSQVYVTIIYTGGDLSNEHYQDTLNNIKTAKSLGIIPIVRTWGQMFGDEAKTAALNLNRMAAEVGSFRVYYGNELNLSWEGCNADPAKCAQSFNDFLSGINYNPQFQLSLPPIAGHQGGNEFNFLKNFLSQKLANGQTIAQFYQAKGNGMVATIYGASVQEILQQIDDTNRVLSSYGLKVTGISEIGPFVNGGLLQGVEQMNQWIATMTPIFQYFVTHPEALTDRGISFLNTSFFADLDGDGFPDVTLLVVVDENGNIKILQEALIIGGGFGWDLMRKYSCSINGTIPESNKFPFRPSPCKNCKLDVAKPTQSCAQPPVVVQYQTYSCGNISTCPQASKFIAELDWSPVSFKLNTKDTKVPFAGFKEVLRGSADDPVKSRAENENNYINDYFEGTALFDKRDFDMSNPNDTKDFYWEYGVYRKLAPAEFQDGHRKNMILRKLNYVVEGIVYDIGQGGSKSNPRMVTKHIQDWAQPTMKAYDGSSGRLPPDQPNMSGCTDQTCFEQRKQHYQDILQAWQRSEWGQLWQHIPLFSREDAPGKIVLTVEHTPGTIDEGKSTSREEVPLSIPHLTRLYESTTALYNLLTPTMQKQQQTAYVPQQQTQVSYVPKSTPVLLAQAAFSSDAQEPRLLAQGGQPSTATTCDAITILRNSDGSFSFREHLPNGCYYRDVRWKAIVEADGRSTSCEGFSPVISNPEDSDPGSADVTPSVGIPCMLPGNDVKVSVIFDSAGRMGGEACDGIPQFPSCSCDVQTQANGSVSTTCSTGATIPPPEPCTNQSNVSSTCDSKNPMPDLKPNDEICCSSKAVINVENYQEQVTPDVQSRLCNPECRIVGYDQDENGLPVPIKECDDPKETAKMTRKVSVELSIPYLKDVYGKTAGRGMSIFNLFKPSHLPDFPDDDALSGITYEIQSQALSYLSFTGVDDALEGQQTLKGNLYFPYLGGIQQAKKCVSEQILVPTELQAPINQCQFFGGDYLNPVASKPQDQSSCTPLPKDLPYRAAENIDKEQLRATFIKRVGEKMGGDAVGAGSDEARNVFNQRFDSIYDGAVSANWNPAWVLTLWVEESAASSVSAWDLGCIYDQDATPLPRNDLPRQLQCLFNKDYADANNYKQFMLNYSGEAGNNGLFCNNPGFPIKIDKWYTVLTTDVSYNSLQ